MNTRAKQRKLRKRSRISQRKDKGPHFKYELNSENHNSWEKCQDFHNFSNLTKSFIELGSVSAAIKRKSIDVFLEMGELKTSLRKQKKKREITKVSEFI